MSTLYTPEFCLKLIRTMHTMKAPSYLKPIDYAVMSHVIARLPEQEVSYISNYEMAEQLGCDPRPIADSYARLKKAGWLNVAKNVTRSPKLKGFKIVGRRPATVTVNVAAFPDEIKKAAPVSDSAKKMASTYVRILMKQTTKAARYARKQGRVFEEKQERAVQKFVNHFDGDTAKAAKFINFALGKTEANYESSDAWQSLSRLYQRRKKPLADFAAWTSAQVSKAA